MSVLGAIVFKGNVGNVQVLVDSGIVGKLQSLLSSSTGAIVKKSTYVLGQLTYHQLGIMC